MWQQVSENMNTFQAERENLTCHFWVPNRGDTPFASNKQDNNGSVLQHTQLVLQLCNQKREKTSTTELNVFFLNFFRRKTKGIIRVVASLGC